METTGQRGAAPGPKKEGHGDTVTLRTSSLGRLVQPAFAL